MDSGTKLRLEETVPNPENVNSGIEYFCQVTEVTNARNRACLSLLTQVSREKGFDFLRTKLQLGYLVWSGIREIVTTEGFDSCFELLTLVDIALSSKARNHPCT